VYDRYQAGSARAHDLDTTTFTSMPDTDSSNIADCGQRRKFGCCMLCERETHLTFHHLIPRKAHKRKSFRKRYRAADLQKGIDICRLCHNAIHKFYDEMWIARNLNTLQLLKQNSLMARHIQWARKQRVKQGS